MQKVLFLSLFLLLPLLSSAQGLNFPSHYKGPTETPFEKIYVERSQIVTLPDGIYYADEEGNLIKAQCLRADCDGSYVIVIKRQCQLCGRCYEGKFLDEEYGCPIFQRKVSSRLWVD
jgi:hypothetical protein